MMGPGFRGGGGGFGGGAGSAAPNLPFAGIPPEYAEAIGDLLRDEREPDPYEAELDMRGASESKPFGLWEFLAPQWRALAFAALLIATEQIAVHSGPLLLREGIDQGIMPKNVEMLMVFVGLYFVVIGLHWAVAYVQIRFTGRLGQKLMYALRLRVFTHLQRLGLDFYTAEKGGRIMTRMTSDITALATLFNEGIVNMAVQLLTLGVVVAFMCYIDAQLTGILLVATVPPLVALTLWFRSASSRAYDAVRDRIAEVLADLQESLAGVRIVAMHNRQRHNIIKHRNTVGRHVDANIHAAHVSSIYGPSTTVVDALGQCVVLLVGGTLIGTGAASGELSAGDVAAFLFLVTSIFAPIQELVQLYNTYQSGAAAVVKLRGVLSTRPNVPEAADAMELEDAQGEIALEGVTFGYDKKVPVLRDVDLTIHAGETFALVGSTGAGKSTLAKLVTRFYDPQAGRITIDGHDLRDLDLRSLRRQIGIVPQEAFLFAGTLRDNIAFARPEASDEEILAACASVGISELIERLPRGIDTPCHERGVTLSSGERQLIALARAFLAEPRVLVLDEATSNLDLQTEAMVERALDALLGGRTAILIAHRLSTAMRANRIGVIQDGRLAEVGSHAELMELGGTYAHMYETWIQHGGHDDAISDAPDPT